MPVAVIALAAGSMAAGATAFAAATTLAGMVVAGAAVVGGALTIVGTVTGNAKLTKIGAIVGLAGAAGSFAMSMANGAGAAAGAAEASGAAATDAATSAASAAGEAAGTATSAAGSAVGDALGAAAGDAASTAGSAANNMGGSLLDAAGMTTSPVMPPGGLLDAATSAGAQPAASATADALGAGNAAGQAGQAAFDSGSTAVGQANNINAFKAATPLEQLGQKAASGSLLDGLENYGSAINSAGPVADTSMLGQLGTYGTDLQAWAKANPLLAKAALDGTGAFVKGMVPTDQEKAQMAYYKAQTDAAARRARWGSGRI